MDLEHVKISEISQRQILYDIIFMWNLKKNTTASINKTDAYTKTFKKTYGYQKGKGVGEREIRNMG